MKIIHIEDNELDAELIQAALHAASITCDIVRVKTREQFELEVQKQPPDVVLSDSKLPGFDTSQALAFIRTRHPKTPFIYVTGNASPLARQVALEQGALDFVNKDDLSALVRMLKNKDANAPMKPGSLPEVDRVVIARCATFRCLAYRNAQGEWRDYMQSRLLPEVLDWDEI